MFDIGFSELLLVGLVALIVFGPERLPGAVRTAGLVIGRLKRSVSSIKQDIEREIGADEIRRQLHNEQILQMERELKESMQSVKSSVTEAGQLLNGTSATPTSEPAAPAPAPAPAPASSVQPSPAPATPATVETPAVPASEPTRPL